MKILRKYWFGILLGGLSFIFLMFVIIVAMAPHNDDQMRGFTPCTYQMAVRLNTVPAKGKVTSVLSAVSDAYLCYAEVVGEGVLLFFKGEQPTPWANYFFKVDDPYEIPPEESEPFSEDLLKANLLDDDETEEM